MTAPLLPNEKEITLRWKVNELLPGYCDPHDVDKITAFIALHTHQEVAKARIDDRNAIVKLKNQFVNLPLDERLNGWDWLNKAESAIAELSPTNTTKEVI